MKKLLWITVLLLPALLLAACGAAPAEGESAGTEAEAGGLYVRPVEDLPQDFILGMDVSSLIAEEESGVRYFDFDGQEKDLLQILAENGVTHIRLRVWNDPYDEQGRGFGGGNCDADKALRLGQRAAAAGLRLIVDFHYSDFWADPGKQMVPRAWAGMDAEEKAEAVYAFTRESLQLLRDGGVDVAMVQIGNETNGALCGEGDWAKIQLLMKAGSRAVREVFPEALVALHFTNPERAGSYSSYARELERWGVDYDVFASSYYSFWHGDRDNLSRVLGEINRDYGKRVMVMETSWPYTGEDSDFSGNNINGDSAVPRAYPFTVQGQATSLRDVADTVAHTPGGIGVCYWEGAWISVGGSSREENSALWERFGSGWASSYAGVYDPKDAGQYYGGSSWDNQAFFDPSGHPLASLRVFALLRSGSEVPLRPDAAEDCAVTAGADGTVVLPETVNAVMNDNSLRPVPVTWDADAAELSSRGPGTYEIAGRAEGLPVRCLVTVPEKNLLENGNFETGALEPWTLIERGHADQLYVEDKAGDSLDGRYHMHFWSAASDSVDFSLEQTRTDLPAGTYRFSISIMGGDSGEAEVFAYAAVDGQMLAVRPMQITRWNEWDTAVLGGIRLEAGQTLTVGVSVKCRGEGSGAWGKIDGAVLCAEG